MLSVFSESPQYPDKTAIISDGENYSYEQLHSESDQVAATLLNGKKDLEEARVAFMISPGFDYVKVQWGIWKAGGIAVPLSLHSPYPALEYVLEDAQCEILIAEESFIDLLTPAIESRKYRFLKTDEFLDNSCSLPTITPSRRAMIIYTSGTTGKPKGVVTTHANIESQVSTLVEAWVWSSDDHILNVLPLHHVHGVINVLSCALYAGACCEFEGKFEAKQTLDLLAAGQVNLFMAVPTIYYKLIIAWQQLPEKRQKEIGLALQKFRLMVSGSAALPVSVLEQWENISGHRLLERYGMTEIGMAISNPYEGERKPGHIGQPLPGVQVRLTKSHDSTNNPLEPSEIQVKGLSIFKEYWNKKEATKSAFTKDGWFKTGDMAVLNEGSYRIMGRKSVDIIKSGGYKISALEIEEVMREHPAVSDCAVVGLPDPEWDEIIAAGIVLKEAGIINVATLKDWLEERLPAYQVPRQFLFLEELPRNAMGKVTKPALKKLFAR